MNTVINTEDYLHYIKAGDYLKILKSPNVSMLKAKIDVLRYEINELERKRSELYEDPAVVRLLLKVSGFVSDIWGIIGLVIILFNIPDLFNQVKKAGSDGIYPIVIKILVIIILIIMFFAPLWITKFISKYINKKKFKKIDTVNDQINKKSEEVDMNIKEISDNIGFLHVKYCTPEILDKLTDYFETHRADNIKEALNIFEKEQVDERKIEAINDLGKNMSSFGY